MNVFMIGDIVGNVGMTAIKEQLPKIKKEYKIDFTVANVENSSNGKGIIESVYDFLYMAGIDVMTLGNHTWARKDVIRFIERKE